MTPILDIDALDLRFGQKVVLAGISLTVTAGELVALTGANGSGKSSLLRCIAGQWPASSGQIRIDGLDPISDALAARRQFGLAVAPELLPPLLSPRECLALFAEARECPAAMTTTLERAEALRMSAWLDTPVAACSLGTRQKLGILLGLLGDPPLLLLDEPVNGLDPPAAWALKQLLAERARAGAAVLLATHAIGLAERHATRVLLLHAGRLIRDWGRDELAGLRADPERSLEAELVSAMSTAA